MPDKSKQLILAEDKPDDLSLAIQSSDLSSELKAELAKELEKPDEVVVSATPPRAKISKDGDFYSFEHDDTPVRKFRGIILHAERANAYWHEKDSKSNMVILDDIPTDWNHNVPLCASNDLISGSKDQATGSVNKKAVKCFGRCGECFLNDFGTAVDDAGQPQKGKACTNVWQLIVLREGYKVPYLLTLTPTSLKVFEKYIQGIQLKGWSTWTVLITFETEVVKEDKKTWGKFKGGDYIRLTPDAMAVVFKMKKETETVLQGDITEKDREFMSSEESEIVDAEIVEENPKSDKDDGLPF